MIGLLPKSLRINGKNYKIHTDFRYVLLVIQAINDPNLRNEDKAYIMLDTIVGVDNIKPCDYEEALKQVSWFIDGGKEYEKVPKPKLMDWEQDEQMIFSAVNKIAGQELRSSKYIHWWSFLGYFNEIGDGLFSQVITIRRKKATNKKLEKYEREFVQNNKELFKVKKKLSEKEREEEERLNNLFK